MSDRLTRNEQREAARAKAKALREQHRKGEQRKRLVIQLSVVVGTLGIVAAVAFAIISGANTASNSGLTPKNFGFDNGIKLGANAEPFTSTSNPTVAPTPGAKKPVAIQVSLEYQCPACAALEATHGDQLKRFTRFRSSTAVRLQTSIQAVQQMPLYALPRTHRSSSLPSPRSSTRSSRKKALQAQATTSSLLPPSQSASPTQTRSRPVSTRSLMALGSRRSPPAFLMAHTKFLVQKTLQLITPRSSS